MEDLTNVRAIVPAAGKGTRLKSGEDLPKVLHTACDRPLLELVLQQLDFLRPEEITIVVGYQKAAWHRARRHDVRAAFPWF